MQFQILQCLKKRYPKQPNTIRYVILKSAKITANFTAFLATYNCVNNAHMIIGTVWKARSMNWLSTHYAHDNSLKRNASSIQLEIYTFFVNIAIVLYVLSACSWRIIPVIKWMIWKTII